MGMDLVLAHLAIREDVTPNWEAARTRIVSLTDEEIEAFAPLLVDEHVAARGPEYVRSHLAEIVDEVADALDGSSAVAIIEVPGWQIFISGGPSWGDSPGGLYDKFNDLAVSGLAEAAGFELHGQ